MYTEYNTIERENLNMSSAFKLIHNEMHSFTQDFLLFRENIIKHNKNTNQFVSNHFYYIENKKIY